MTAKTMCSDAYTCCYIGIERLPTLFEWLLETLLLDRSTR